jgi:hypothetical protein
VVVAQILIFMDVQRVGIRFAANDRLIVKMMMIGGREA